MNEFIKTPKLDDLFAKYAEEVGEAVIDDDFGYGSTDTGTLVMLCQQYILILK